MKIRKKAWIPYKEQVSNIRRYSWSVARLVELAKDLPVFEIPVAALDTANCYQSLNMREMVMHMQAVLDADLNYPIILNEDGELMDGRHRIMKAILNECETIKAVRFEVDPSPCVEREE